MKIRARDYYFGQYLPGFGILTDVVYEARRCNAKYFYEVWDDLQPEDPSPNDEHGWFGKDEDVQQTPYDNCEDNPIPEDKF